LKFPPAAAVMAVRLSGGKNMSPEAGRQAETAEREGTLYSLSDAICELLRIYETDIVLKRKTDGTVKAPDGTDETERI